MTGMISFSGKGPKGLTTAEILAAARAQGAQKPAPSSDLPLSAPSALVLPLAKAKLSTREILALARQQSGIQAAAAPSSLQRVSTADILAAARAGSIRKSEAQERPPAPLLAAIGSVLQAAIDSGKHPELQALESFMAGVLALSNSISVQDKGEEYPVEALAAGEWFQQEGVTPLKPTAVHLLMLEDGIGLNAEKTLRAIYKLTRKVNPLKRAWQWACSGITVQQLVDAVKPDLAGSEFVLLLERLQLLEKAGLLVVKGELRPLWPSKMGGRRIQLTEAGVAALNSNALETVLKLGVEDYKRFFQAEIGRLKGVKTRQAKFLTHLAHEGGQREQMFRGWQKALEQLKVDMVVLEKALAENKSGMSAVVLEGARVAMTECREGLTYVSQNFSYKRQRAEYRGEQQARLKVLIGAKVKELEVKVAKLFESLGEADKAEQNQAMAGLMRSANLVSEGEPLAGGSTGFQSTVDAMRRLYIHSDVTLDMASKPFEASQAAAREEEAIQELLDKASGPDAGAVSAESQPAGKKQEQKS